ncbi:MAG: hypothetical protein IPP47_06615 [Bryobacterales bacterium]|nr:hypothetical protein [Bryobacterales bacterium]
MIDVKEAVLVARQKASEVLNQPNTNIEEIEKDEYKGRQVWSITLSYLRGSNQGAGLAGMMADPLKYKRFFVDAETGELYAIRVREIAVR